MWLKWFPWRFVVRRLARTQGFLDPISLFSRLRRFSQPSEVIAPTELLRAGAVLQARGLMNSQAIQHNLDWIWPYWVERQFNPSDDAFIPRAFNVAHINLTHRNWTAIGVPSSSELPLVDPRGLLTPFYDGWSLDAWIVSEKGFLLVPSRAASARQELSLNGNISVKTSTTQGGATLESTADVVVEGGAPVCRLQLKAASPGDAWLAVALRPYNPEGVSLVDNVALLSSKDGWKVNGRDSVYWDVPPERYRFSQYKDGDVCLRFFDEMPSEEKIKCNVGMATAAALFRLPAGELKAVTLRVPLGKSAAGESWPESLEGHCRLRVPDERFQFLYDAALRTLVLHSPDGTVYPGPYTYKRFWFRDAAFILDAMLCAGLVRRAEKVLDKFPSRQTPFGYFLSQDGEWDSNGQALWILRRFCELTNRPPKEEWKGAILRGARWIERKRTPLSPDLPHAGLLPAGFSAEHFGPNDYYYWDDFWGVAGLRAASFLAGAYGEKKAADEFKRNADDFQAAIETSIKRAAKTLGVEAIPASPYRRMDAGAIGSLTADYPLKIWKAGDKKICRTASFLVDRYFIDGAFFQEISHSGMNPYLTLHAAQVFLRAGDPRYWELMRSVASLASPTGQWPEAVHPRTRGGCMGDGQHVWAAAEWVLMIRNCFVREEESENTLVLFSGIPEEWTKKPGTISFGPTLTTYGEVSVELVSDGKKISTSWKGNWHGKEPKIKIALPTTYAQDPLS